MLALIITKYQPWSLCALVSVGRTRGAIVCSLHTDTSLSLKGLTTADAKSDKLSGILNDLFLARIFRFLPLAYSIQAPLYLAVDC